MNNKPTDRHENKNWVFVKSKPDPILDGEFIRMYKSTSNPRLYKKVSKRTGSSCSNLWDSVCYTLKGEVDRYGNLSWVRSVAEALYIPTRNAEMEAIWKGIEELQGCSMGGVE